MTAVQIRHSIHSIIDDTADEAVLVAYHGILQNLLTMQSSFAALHWVHGIPLSLEEYVSEVVASSQRVKNGQFIAHESLEKEVENQ